MTKETKYSLACFALLVMLFVSYRYLNSAFALRRDGPALRDFIILGIVILLFNAVALVAFTYYKKLRSISSDSSKKGAELQALGMLAPGNTSGILHNIDLAYETYLKVEKLDQFHISASLFHKPFVVGDYAILHAMHDGQEYILTTKVALIDRYNDKIYLQQTTQR